MSLLVTLAVARYLLPEQFGRLNYLIALVSLVSPLITLGLNSIISRELLQRPTDKYQIMGSALTLRALSALIMAPLAIWLFSLYLQDRDKALFALLIVFSVFNAAQVVEFWLQAYVANRYAAVVRLISLTVFSLARLLAVELEASLDIFVYLAAFEMAFTGILYLIIYNRLSGGMRYLKASVKESRRLLKDSRWLMISAVAATIYLKIDQVMLGALVDERAVGIYAAAARISEVWYFIPMAIAASLFPKLMHQRENNKAGYQLELQKINDVLFFSGLAIALAVSSLAEILLMLFGEAYAASAPILIVHIWAGIFVFTRALLSKWFIIENLLKLSLLSQVSGALLNIILNLKLIPLYGAMGAAYATVLSYAVAGYFVLFCHRDLWPMASIVTKSLFLPLRVLQKGRRLYKL